MTNNREEALITALDTWIDTLNHPGCQVRSFVPDLKDRRNRIINDFSQVKKELVNGNIWGGMGSLLDCALFKYPHPTSTNPAVRAVQWQSAADEANHWQLQFFAATITLGTILLAWLADNDELITEEERAIKNWLGIFETWLERPIKTLSAINIEVLEANLRNNFL